MSNFRTKNKLPNIKRSYGILCSRFNKKTKKIEFLLIQKRTTFYYTEFILKYHYDYRYSKEFSRGSANAKDSSRNFVTYNSDLDEEKLLYLFDHMTYEEKLDILSLDFGRMWYRIWMVNPETSKEIYNDSK